MEELRLCNDKLRQFEDDKEKAHSCLVDNCCSTLMKNRIKEKSDFETKVRNDPNVTLDCMRECMCVSARSKCECNTLTESLEQLIIDTKQNYGERLVD